MERFDPQNLTEAEVDAAFDCLKAYGHAVLAVSGGPDSMALMLLAARWRVRHADTAPMLSVATVDHRLRDASRAEAEFVGQEAAGLGLAHCILPWIFAKPATGIPNAARQARYRLLDEHARGLGAGRHVAVVTAHHRDDQAETFTMRLARGAGVNGLAAMRTVRPLAEGSTVDLVRPLLAVSKRALAEALNAAEVGFIDDPSNRDVRYERSRVRGAMRALEAAGISPTALGVSARRLGEAEAALRYAEDHFTATLGLSFGNGVCGQFSRDDFRAGPAALGQRVMARLIALYGGASERPRLDEVEELTARVRHTEKCTATLGGTMIAAGTRFVRIWREVGRLAEADLPLHPGDSKLWDRRFRVTRLVNAGGPVIVRALGAKDYLKISGGLSSGGRLPARAAHAVPAFWSEERLIAVPSLAPFVRPGLFLPGEAGCLAEALSPSVPY